jgi:hypothetical protein
MCFDIWLKYRLRYHRSQRSRRRDDIVCGTGIVFSCHKFFRFPPARVRSAFGQIVSNRAFVLVMPNATKATFATNENSRDPRLAAIPYLASGMATTRSIFSFSARGICRSTWRASCGNGGPDAFTPVIIWRFGGGIPLIRLARRWTRTGRFAPRALRIACANSGTWEKNLCRRYTFGLRWMRL